MEIQRLDRVSKITGAVISIVFGVISLILLNLFYDKIPLLDDSFTEVLIYLNASIVVRLILDGTRIMFTSEKYRHGIEIINNVISMGIFYILFTKFPFDTSTLGDSENLDMAFRGVLLILLVSSFFGIFTNFTRVVQVEEPEYD